MRTIPVLVLLAIVLQASLTSAAELPPVWAYPVNPPDMVREKDDGTLRHVPGSSIGMTLTQVRDPFSAPDWHPEEHGVMPDVVAHGHKPDVWACGFCHRATGPGGPENANLTGLTIDYMQSQIAAFRDGTRRTFEAKRGFFGLMTKIARGMTEEESLAAAQYFAAQPYQSMVEVVETTDVPKTTVLDWHLVPVPSGGTEPIGTRIIETPADEARFTSRDTRVSLIAYVPPGSIEQGRVLATSGSRTVVCTSCHGQDLKGSGVAPAIIGRSATFIVRQLFDIREGSRTGANSALMKPAVEQLTLDDMIALAAYTSSLKP